MIAGLENIVKLEFPVEHATPSVPFPTHEEIVKEYKPKPLEFSITLPATNLQTFNSRLNVLKAHVYEESPWQKS